MKIYEKFNEYGLEDFTNNVKFSCHSWILDCILNIHKAEEIVDVHSLYINDLDLTGKYNAANFLLDVFSYYQNCGFRNYPQGRNKELDFSIIIHFLMKNNVNLDIKDYEQKSFLDNVELVYLSQENLYWKKPFTFLSQNTLNFISDKNENDYLNYLLSNENSSCYLKIKLDFELPLQEKVIKKFKL